MNDFNGSVAQQDVSISTDIVKTVEVGGHYYENVLYVTDRFSLFNEDTTVYTVVTKDIYEDVIADYAYLSDGEKKIILGNLASLFAYGQDLTVYIIPAEQVKTKKFTGYFTYLDLEWKTGATEAGSDYTLAESATTTITNLGSVDKAFTHIITDMPVDPTTVKGTSTTKTAGTLALISNKTFDITLFARPAFPTTGTAGDKNAYVDADGDLIGYSPALYQLGRTLSYVNESGTPVGSSFDMTAMEFQNVLPTADTGTEEISGAGAVFANWFEANNVNYFKLVGNGTSNVTNFGGWTIKKNCTSAEWIVAYENYMNRVACATIITSGKSLKNPKTYGDLLDAVKSNIAKMVATGRVTDFVLTAPNFDKLPKTNGHTIAIPNAWSGTYVDNVRKVKLSGTLTVSA